MSVPNEAGLGEAMGREVQQLLEELGLGRAAKEWDRVVLLASRGSPVSQTSRSSDHVADRGFHLVLLDMAGEPEYYCKCRPALPNGALHWESEVLEMFSSDSRTRSLVPKVGLARTLRIDLQVTPFHHGQTLAVAMKVLPAKKRWQLVRQVLRAMGELSQVMREYHERRGASRILQLRNESDGLMSTLAEMGVDERDRTLISRVFTAVDPVPSIPQHGDLWPPNVITGPCGQLTVLDLGGGWAS